MDFSLSDDQEALRELARKILTDRAAHDRLKEVEATEERVDRSLWAELAKAHLLGIAIDEEHGGSGLGVVEWCLLLEEIGRAVAPVPVFPTLVLGALPIAEFGSEEQRRRILPRVASGEMILSASLVETGDSETTASHDGTGWRLTGERPFVPAGHVAQRVLVPARTGEGTLGVFLVDPGSDGVTRTPVETTSLEIQPTLSLQRVRVPDGDVLRDPKTGGAIVEWVRERALLGLCAMQLGVATRALEMTAAYTSERRQFDRPIGSFQAVHQRTGDAYVDVQAMKLTLWRAMHRVAQGEPAAEALAVAKYWAAEGGARVTYAAQHLHGGIGMDTDYPLHRYYLWGRQLGITLGSGSACLAALGAGLAAA